ncbi:hypothetical protein [Natronospora cellulosivora (SeqCode)]
MPSFTKLSANKNNYISLRKTDYIRICVDVVKLRINYKDCFEMIWGLKEEIKEVLSFDVKLVKVDFIKEKTYIKAVFIISYNIVYLGKDGEIHKYFIQNTLNKKISKGFHLRNYQIKLFHKNLEYKYYLINSQSLEVDIYIRLSACLLKKKIICLPVIK